MEELIKRLERVIQTGAPDKDGLHPIAAEVVLEVVKELTEHGTNLAEVDTDTISRQAAIDAVNCVMVMKGIRGGKGVAAEAVESAKRIMTDNIRQLPSTQLEIVRCKDCKYWNSGYCECPEPVINTEAEHFCGYADKKEVTTWAKSN